MGSFGINYAVAVHILAYGIYFNGDLWQNRISVECGWFDFVSKFYEIGAVGNGEWWWKRHCFM